MSLLTLTMTPELRIQYPGAVYHPPSHTAMAEARALNCGDQRDDIFLEDEDGRTRNSRGEGRTGWWAGCGSALACFAVAATCLLGGCATKESTAAAPRPGSGVGEYRELTSEAGTAVRAALAALDKVSAASNPCPPRLVAAYVNEVQRLHVDSLRIRARGQAIQARGDAYFADWTETMARIQDPQIRERAERYRPELQQCFSRIKLVSQQAGAAFKPFMSGLRMLRVQLDKPPPATADDTTKDLIRTTREHGGEVLKALSGINNELDTITRLLTPGKNSRETMI